MDTPPILPAPAAPPARRRKGRTKYYILAAAVLVALGVFMFLALDKKDAAISVQTEKVGRHTITETVTANGKIYPVVQVHISPEVSGEITELQVKEGQFVHKGDLLLKIKPEFYQAALNQAQANYQSSLASKTSAEANLERAEADFKRNEELFHKRLISDSDFVGFKVGQDVARAQVESAIDQVNVAKAAVDSAQDSLSKTIIVSPLDGTVSKLNSQLGERVLGTVQNAGTDIMIISDLSQMEARVDIGEMDIVMLAPGEQAKLEVDSFKNKKFAGVVTDVANSSEGLNASTGLGGLGGNSSAGQSATQFQVRIRFTEAEQFRPGMSVTAEIETRTHTNTIAGPIACITTRLVGAKPGETNSAATNLLAAANSGTNAAKADKKAGKDKPVEVVFVLAGDHVKTVPVKIGISDVDFWEITEGLAEGDVIVTGNYHAISHDLEDGKKVTQSSNLATNANADKTKM